MSGNTVFTEALFAVNGSPRRFSRNPGAWDANASAHYESSRVGRLKLFGMTQRDDVGVEHEADGFRGFIESASTNRLASAHWQRSAGPWAASAMLSASSYSRETAVGVIDVDVADQRRAWRLDLERPAAAWTFRLGTDGSQARTRVGGRVPLHGGDFGGIRGSRLFDLQYDDWHAGLYAESERRRGRVLPYLGVRVDRFDKAGAVTADPRAGVMFRPSDNQRVRLAAGLYRQAAPPEYYDAVRGATRLEPMRARHLVLGYEAGSPRGAWIGRVETYHKSYRFLPLEHAEHGYTSDGYGSAYGLDALGQMRWASGELRFTYSWLHARRRWTPSDQQDRFELPPGTWTPDFEIPHTLHAVGRYNPIPAVALGVSWRIASGTPHTPVVAATRSDAGFTPVFGAINSGRLPRYERWDVSASYLTTMWRGTLAVFFIGLNNVLARDNAFEYAYSEDYSERRPVQSGAPRAVYFGLSLSR